MIIIPKNLMVQELDATNKEEAVIKFAGKMDSDMNVYFTAVDASEFNQTILNLLPDEIIYAAHRKFVIDFMSNELVSSFGLSQKAAKEYGEIAYDIYCEGDGKTEYECIEEAYERYKSSKTSKRRK